MPDLNRENKEVELKLLKWLNDTIRKYDFDGVRYSDVANVPKWFWKKFSKEADTYTFGIVSSNESEYIADYQNYMDGVGDYPLFYSIRESFLHSMKNLSYYHNNNHNTYINASFIEECYYFYFIL